MEIALFYDIALHLHVLHNEVCTIQRVRHDTTNEGCSQHDSIGFLFIKESLHSKLIG